ncbi:MAG: hypothetical protein HY287_01620 [Planctomycetes bacterium]|nr:hypothetical protein [Planctomycetota bacterium]MBI3833007.1 hypothetical protein [Planctomycetota bacterium]
MNTFVPNRFLFDFEFPLRFRESPPEIDGSLRGWTDAELIPSLGAIDGLPDYAPVWSCWNERGIYAACRVAGKKKPLRCDPKNFRDGDNFRLCIDTRYSRANKRATRYSRQFFFLPTGGGVRRDQSVAGLGEFAGSREKDVRLPIERIRVASRIEKTGYSLEAFVPVECLPGFDPQEHPHIGFYHMLEDSELGKQYLTVGDELLWYADPSTWATAVLKTS